MIALVRREFTVDRPIEMAWHHLAGFGVSVFGRLFAKIYSKNLDRAIPLLVDELKSGVAWAKRRGAGRATTRGAAGDQLGYAEGNVPYPNDRDHAASGQRALERTGVVLRNAR